MVFDSYVQNTYGGALADLRDKAGGSTGWTIENDDASGGDLVIGDSFTLGTAPSDSGNQEYIQITLENNFGGIQVDHGTSVDGSGLIDSKWDYDPVEAGLLHDEPDGTSTTVTVTPRASLDTDTPMLASDSGSYWLTCVERGFAFYFQREQADGEDADFFLGVSEVSKAWDYHTASNEESEWVLGLSDTASGNSFYTYMSNSGTTDPQSSEKTHFTGNNDYNARGLVNPDPDLDNYPVTNNVIGSRTWRNVEQEDIILGTNDMWGDDISGSDTGHRDLVVDGSSNTIYTVLKRSDTPSIILRSD